MIFVPKTLSARLIFFQLSISILAVLTCAQPGTVEAQPTLTNGWSNPGSISAAGQISLWSIPANQGDSVAVQVAKLTGGAGFSPKIELFSPDGVSLGAQSGGVAARLDIQANTNGVYSLQVSDEFGTGTGTFSVQLAQVPGTFTVPAGDEGGALTNGAIHTGTIAVGDLDMWSIPAAQGDRIVVQIAELSGGAGFTPMIELFGPDGTRLGTSSGEVAARLDIQARSAGTYTVLVSDAGQSGSGNYQLELAQVPGAFVVPTGDEGGALASAVDTDGTIQLGDLDLWTFVAGPGDHVRVQATKLTGGAGFTPMIELFTPSGERKAFAENATTAVVDIAAEVSGTYTLLVSDANQSGTGTYRLNLSRDSVAAPGPNILTNGTTASGSITTADRTNSWTFTASAGESVIVRAGEITTGSLVPWLRLYGPTGAFLQQDFNAAAAEVTLRVTNSGTFQVIVSDGSGSRNQTGDFRISLAKTGTPLTISSGDEGGALTNGAIYLGTIDTGDIDAWTFTANVGEAIVVRIAETAPNSPLFPWLRLYGPNGALLSQDFSSAAAEVTTRATNSGTFMVVVADGNNGLGGSGNYRLNVAMTGDQPSVSTSDEGGPLVDGTTYLGAIDTGDLDVWTFTADKGESVLVRMGEITAGSGLFPWLRLYGPNGALLDQDFSSAVAEVTVRATNSGTFTVIASDGNSGLAGSGNYRISLAKTGSRPSISASDEGGPLINGTTYLAAIDTGDLDAWTVDAAAGESIIVRMGEMTAGSPLYPWLRMYGPDGALVAQDFNAAAAEVTARATNTGIFLVVAADGNSGLGGAGNYRISLAKTGSEPTISATDEGGPLVNGTTYLGAIDTGDLDEWTFMANARDSIIVRMGETVPNSGLYPWLRLYGPEGALLDQSFNASVAEVTIRATNNGLFMVVAADGNSGLGGSGTYRISLAKTGIAPVISSGDEGGGMTGVASYAGAIDVGDLDLWTFTACYGDPLSINVTEMVNGSGLFPWIRLYGPDGSLLNNAFGTATAQIDRIAPASGTYSLVVADGNSNLGGSGAYQLSANDLSTGVKFCSSTPASPNLDLNGIGGVPGAGFVMLTATNLGIPLNQWTPIYTNAFNILGGFGYTNVMAPTLQQQYFRLQFH